MIYANDCYELRSSGILLPARSLDVARALLQPGQPCLVDINAPISEKGNGEDDGSFTFPLLEACYARSGDMVQLLIQYGADTQVGLPTEHPPYIPVSPVLPPSPSPILLLIPRLIQTVPLLVGAR